MAYPKKTLQNPVYSSGRNTVINPIYSGTEETDVDAPQPQYDTLAPNSTYEVTKALYDIGQQPWEPTAPSRTNTAWPEHYDIVAVAK
jgi:hypothetical protein